jgi:mRNA-degrading endonuclease RelE of RelBE toxin-antitoxin system
MTYKLLIEKRAVEELKTLPPEIRERIKKKIRDEKCTDRELYQN